MQWWHLSESSPSFVATCLCFALRQPRLSPTLPIQASPTGLASGTSFSRRNKQVRELWHNGWGIQETRGWCCIRQPSEILPFEEDCILDSVCVLRWYPVQPVARLLRRTKLNGLVFRNKEGEKTSVKVSMWISQIWDFGLHCEQCHWHFMINMISSLFVYKQRKWCTVHCLNQKNKWNGNCEIAGCIANLGLFPGYTIVTC